MSRWTDAADAHYWALVSNVDRTPASRPPENPLEAEIRARLAEIDEQLDSNTFPIRSVDIAATSFEATCTAENATEIPLRGPQIDSPGLRIADQGNPPPSVYKPPEGLILQQARWCACGCGGQLPDRPNQKYLNERHKSRHHKRIARQKQRLLGRPKEREHK